MKIEIYNARNGEISGEILAGENLNFCAVRPSVIQPSEIIKVQTGLIVQVPSGYVLNISSASELTLLAGELFPGLIAVGSADKQKVLDLPVRNSGRNPLQIRPGQRVAVGYVVAIEVPQIEETILPLANQQSSPNKPQKKNPGIKFEVH